MTLDALGVDFGDRDVFYAPDEWNQEGYFERRDIIDLNSRIITGFARTQGALPSGVGQVRYLLQPSSRSMIRRAQLFSEQIKRTADILGDIFVKDPRFALTLPAWHPYVRQVIVSLRRPDHVALSLKRRQRVPLRVSYGFWNYHARALLALQHEHVHYVDFDVLAGESPDAELTGLARFLGLETSSCDLRAALASKFAPQLKHFDSGVPAQLPSPTDELWEELSARRRAAGH